MKQTRVASRRDYHIVYKTTCQINNRYYIGMHSTDVIEDGYLGSGVRINRSIVKHGRRSHTREILKFLSSREAAALFEKELITSALRADPLCLNCGPGGLGATDRNPEKIAAVMRRPEIRAKVSAGKKAAMTPEVRARLARASKESQNRPEVAAKKALAQRKAMTAKGMHEKLSAASTRANACPKLRAHRSESRKEPCTVDGIWVFPSRTALIAVLGKGKHGLRSPNFRFTQPRLRTL